ncbi:hypothetical protein HYDPIDRAFT_112656, partial [Hydnomerulius pinastri MD-312]
MLALYEIGEPFVQTSDCQLVRALITALSSVMMLLTIFKKYRDYEEYNASLLAVMYRDEIMYMLCITSKIVSQKI